MRNVCCAHSLRTYAELSRYTVVHILYAVQYILSMYLADEMFTDQRIDRSVFLILSSLDLIFLRFVEFLDGCLQKGRPSGHGAVTDECSVSRPYQVVYDVGCGRWMRFR